MPLIQIDYDALAKKYGATSSAVDYDALAQQHGAIQSTPQAPTATIGARPTGVRQWLKDFEGDFRYGTGFTAPGRLLQKMGAQGVNIGSQAAAGDFVMSEPLGAIHVAQGLTRIPGEPWEGTKETVGGLLEMGNKASYFVAPTGPAQQVIGAAGKPITATAERVFASQKHAGKGFQEVMKAAGDKPVQITNELSDAAMQVKQLADAGGSMPKVVRDFLKRVTDPNMPELTFEEARRFASSASRLSADEANRLTPAAARLVKKFHIELNKAIQATADTAGVGQEFAAAMREYAMASQRNQAVTKAGKWAWKYGGPGAVGLWALDKLTGKN